MAQLYWSQDFTIKTFLPRLWDALGVTSPSTIADAADQKLQCPGAAKLLKIKNGAGCTFKLFKDETGVTVENGVGLVVGDDMDIPLEDITFVTIENGTGGSLDIYFEFYLLPDGVENE